MASGTATYSISQGTTYIGNYMAYDNYFVKKGLAFQSSNDDKTRILDIIEK